MAVGGQLPGAGFLRSRGSRDPTRIIKVGQQMLLPGEPSGQPFGYAPNYFGKHVCMLQLTHFKVLTGEFWSTASIFCHSNQKVQVPNIKDPNAWLFQTRSFVAALRILNQLAQHYPPWPVSQGLSALSTLNKTGSGVYLSSPACCTPPSLLGWFPPLLPPHSLPATSCGCGYLACSSFPSARPYSSLLSVRFSFVSIF